MEIRYNSLNLPEGLQFSNGNTTNYVYDAAGQKLSVTYQTAVAGVVIPMTNVMKPLTNAQISQTFKTDYCGNVIYENGRLSRILTEEGYITFSGSTPVYHYYLKDHQGNNRVVLNQNGTVEQMNHYYPFGGLFGASTGGGIQPYKYNGKELDRMHGLDWFDYGARHYDAALGRWWSMDPLAEKYSGMSPYAYCGNNPVRFIDPTGEFPIETIWDIGNVVYDVGAAVVNHIKGDHKTARSHWGDAAIDAGAMFIPYVPAGTSKVIKGGAAGVKALDKTADAGNAMQKLKKSAETGQEAHRQIQKGLKEQGADIEVPMKLNDGTKVRKDAVKPDGTTVIIKPNTPSGQKSAKTRENLMQKNNKKTETILYDPKNPAYQPGSPTYIGPKKKN